MKTVTFKASEEEVALWRKKAAERNLTLSAFIRLSLGGDSQVTPGKRVKVAKSSCPMPTPRGIRCKVCGKPH